MLGSIIAVPPMFQGSAAEVRLENGVPYSVFLYYTITTAFIDHAQTKVQDGVTWYFTDMGPMSEGSDK